MTDEQKASEAARVLGIVNEGAPDEAEKHRRLAELIGHIWDAATTKERFRISDLVWDAAKASCEPRVVAALREVRLSLSTPRSDT